MLKIRSKLNTIGARILIFNLMIVIIVSLGPQMLFIQYFTSAYNKEINNQSAENVRKLKYVVDETILDSVIRFGNIYFTDLPSNETLVYPLTHDISQDGLKIAEVGNFLTDIPNKLTFLQSVEVLYTEGNLYINDRFNSYLNSESSIKGLDGEWIQQLKNIQTPNRWLKPRITRPSDTRVITYLSNIPLMGDQKQKQAVIAVNIRESAIQNLTGSSPSSDEQQLLIMDEEGNVIVDSNDKWQDTNILEMEFTGKVLKNADEGTFDSTVDGAASIISYSKSNYNNWRYISVNSVNSLYQKSQQMQTYLVTATVILLFVNGALSVYLTYWANKPLRRVVQTILNLGRDQSVIEQGVNNEYKLLSGVINGVSEKIADLNDQWEQNKPVIRDKFIMRLLHGDVDPDDHQVGLLEQSLGIHFTYPSITCMVLKVFGTGAIGFENEMVVQYSLLQNLEKDQDGHLFSTIDHAGSIVAVWNYTSRMDIEKIHDSIGSQVKGEFVLAFSRKHETSYDNIAIAYQEACESLRYSFIMPGQSMIVYEDLQIEMRKDFGSSSQLIEQLSAAIRNRNKDRVASILDILEKGLVSGRYGIEYCRNTIFDAVSMVRTSAISLDIDLERLLGYDIRDYGKKLNNVTELKGWLSEVVDQILTPALAEVPDDTSNPFKQQILTYIERNIYNEISLMSLSESIHMNASYLSRIYKSVIGMNFSEHLTHVKMKHAEKLLLKSDLPIKEIAKRLGYASPKYFARLFKEKYDCSPQKYRDSLNPRL
ncbi:helix-turn-helix domain-containing protein [Paenibacillus sp. GCM10027626]|uniref:helix-turn-helix domain-containing protein n=1 Tax=Paenibacillus sp. GCM10027626 TaxID=3273411 RepID=UPI0036427632